MNTANFIGKCKGCKGCVKVSAPEVSRTKAYLGYGRHETRVTRQLPNWMRVEGYDRFFATCLCGKSVEFRKIRGVHSHHECGAKCMASKGPSCECSCGGANHGASWATA